MKERTVGLVTAEEFRKAREAADSLEEAEAKQRQEKEVNSPRMVNDRCLWQPSAATVFVWNRCAGCTVCKLYCRFLEGEPKPIRICTAFSRIVDPSPPPPCPQTPHGLKRVQTCCRSTVLFRIQTICLMVFDADGRHRVQPSLPSG